MEKYIPEFQHGYYMYYGRLGQGKTYGMVDDLLRMLKKGHVVYVHFPVVWAGHDERNSLWSLFLGSIGLKRTFRVFPASNLRRFKLDDSFFENFASWTDCIVAIDEAYLVFDSYEMTRMSLQKRVSVLAGRHFGRSLFYTVQRPFSSHAVLRETTNVFYKCVCLLPNRWIKWSPYKLFVRSEYDLGSDGRIDEDKCYSRSWYFGKRSVYQAYSSTYMRGDLPIVGSDVSMVVRQGSIRSFNALLEGLGRFMKKVYLQSK